MVTFTTPKLQSCVREIVPYLQCQGLRDRFSPRFPFKEQIGRKIGYLGSAAALSFTSWAPSLLYTLGALLAAPVRGTEPLKKHLFTFLRQSELLLGYLAGVFSENALDFCRIDATLHLRYYNREISPATLELMGTSGMRPSEFVDIYDRTLKDRLPSPTFGGHPCFDEDDALLSLRMREFANSVAQKAREAETSAAAAAGGSRRVGAEGDLSAGGSGPTRRAAAGGALSWGAGDDLADSDDGFEVPEASAVAARASAAPRRARGSC